MHTVLLLARCLYILVALQFAPHASAQGLQLGIQAGCHSVQSYAEKALAIPTVCKQVLTLQNAA